MENIDLLMQKIKSKIRLLTLLKEKEKLESGLNIDTSVSREEILEIIKEVDEENKQLIISERKKIEERMEKITEEHKVHTKNQVKKLLIETEMSMKKFLNNLKNKKEDGEVSLRLTSFLFFKIQLVSILDDIICLS